MKLLPENPNLTYLHREAKKLKSRHRARDVSVCERIGHFDTSMHGLSDEAIFDMNFSINDAQRVTAREYSFSSWARLKLFVQKSSQASDEFDAELSATILKRKARYDGLLKRYQKTKWKNGAVEKWDTFGKESGELFKRIYQRYGWPGPNVIGRDAVDACFYLTGGHTYDSDFQLQTINLMNDALPKGECLGSYYASLMDRYLALTYQPSLYGTMSDYNEETGRVELTRNVVDPDNLNVRRAEVGLPNFDSHNQQTIERALKQGWLETDRDKWESLKRKTALKGGYISA